MASENLPDPLAELRDIHLPMSPELWPPAPGWWILASLAVMGFVGIVYLLYRFWKKSAHRRQAQQELNDIFKQCKNDPRSYLERTNQLLKRVALSFYERDQVANLSGESWVAFLDESGGTHEFTMGVGQVLIDGQYAANPDVDTAELNTLVKAWISQHKALDSNNTTQRVSK